MRNDAPDDRRLRAPSRTALLKPDIADSTRVALPPIARVVLWMIGTLLSFSAMAISIRELSATLSIMEILSARAAAGLLIVGALLAIRPALRHDINRRRLGLHVLRNSIHFGAQYLWATSLLLLPLSTVFALEFTMPAWTMLLASLLLKERMTPSRIGAVVLGLLGVLVILRPGIETFHPAALLVLAAALGYSVQNVATKQLTTTESTFAIVFWMNVIQLPLGLIGADPWFATRLGLHELPALAGLGIAGVSAHYCLSNAFRAGDASLVVPLDFLRIPLIAVVGWWLYGEPLDILVFAGAGLIILGLLWNLRREARTGIATRIPASQTAPEEAASP
jgi:drug/metabolite transporter (DMT)-like permease